MVTASTAPWRRSCSPSQAATSARFFSVAAGVCSSGFPLQGSSSLGTDFGSGLAPLPWLSGLGLTAAGSRCQRRVPSLWSLDEAGVRRYDVLIVSEDVRLRSFDVQIDHHLIKSRTGLLAAERRRRIERRVNDEGAATVEALASEFGVSVMTIRRDLAALEASGLLRRVHGGASFPDLSAQEDSFAFRLQVGVDAKQRLTEAVVHGLQAGESVFVDGSSTGFFVARLIVKRDCDVTLLTNSLPIMALFNTNMARRTKLMALGGILRELTLCFVGPEASGSAGRYVADKAVVSCKGLTEDGLVTEPTPGEVEIKQAMLARSKERLLLLDGSKFERRGLYVVDNVTSFSRVLVSDAPTARIVQLQRLGAEVEVV